MEKWKGCNNVNKQYGDLIKKGCDKTWKYPNLVQVFRR